MISCLYSSISSLLDKQRFGGIDSTSGAVLMLTGPRGDSWMREFRTLQMRCSTCIAISWTFAHVLKYGSGMGYVHYSVEFPVFPILCGCLHVLYLVS